MSTRGVWQLEEIIVRYCDMGYSSRGMRAFIESHLPKFVEKNPQLNVVTELKRCRHPELKASYTNGYVWAGEEVCVKRKSPEEILKCATGLILKNESVEAEDKARD